MAELRFPVDIDSGDAAKELDKTLKEIDKLTKEAGKAEASVDKIKQAISSTETKRNSIADQLDDAKNAALEAEKNIKDLKAQLAASQQKTSADPNVKISADEFADELAKQQTIKSEIATQEKLLTASDKKAEKIDASYAKITDKLVEQNEELKKAQGNAEGYRERIGEAETKAGKLTEKVTKEKNLDSVKSALENMRNSVNKGLKNILKYAVGIRTLFSLFRTLKNYTVEAVKAFAENDPETQQHINELKASLTALKGSWGAAFAPIISAVIPMLTTLIGWLTKAANAIAAFFAALSGRSTFKKAVTDSAALSNNLSSGAGAAKELKKEMMGIDTLTVASDNSSSGGGGGGSSTGLSYTDEEISSSILDNMEKIKEIALAIGSAIAGWAIAKVFGGNLKTALGIAASLYGTVELIKDTIDAWENGIDWDSFKAQLSDTALIAGGLWIAFGKIGLAIGLIVGGATMVVTALHEFIETGELSTTAATELSVGILAIGTAIGLLANNWVVVLIAAVVALFAFLASKWDEINAWIQGVVDAVNTFFDDEIAELATKGNALAQIFIVLWSTLQTVFNTIVLVVRTAFDTICALFRTVAAVIRGIATGDWQTALNTIANIWSSVWENIKNGFRNIVNSILGGLESLINGALVAVNNFLASINSIGSFLGFSVNLHISPVSLPRLAKGGIVDGATPFIAGEAGKEAIVPLERNTEWVTMVAKELESLLFSSDIFDKIAQSVSEIPTALDRMTAQLASIGNIQMPAVAMGGVVPPNAFSSANGYGYSSDLENKLDTLLERLTGNQQPFEIYTTVELDKRKVGESVYSYLNDRSRGRGV